MISFRNLDLFEAIKDRLSRKGHLRKLSDNLSSHRNRIPEAMSYNFRVISLNKDIESLYAAIIVAETILDLVYHNFAQGYLEK